MNKKQILLDGFNLCLKNNLCGNYISMPDIEGFNWTDIEWLIDTDAFQLVALTEFGTYRYAYDFGFNFDANLNEFISQLQSFLLKSVYTN